MIADAPQLLAAIHKESGHIPYNLVILQAVDARGVAVGGVDEERDAGEFLGVGDGWLALRGGIDHPIQVTVEAWSAEPPDPTHGSYDERGDAQFSLGSGSRLEMQTLTGEVQAPVLNTPITGGLHVRAFVTGRGLPVLSEEAESWLVRLWPLP